MPTPLLRARAVRPARLRAPPPGAPVGSGAARARYPTLAPPARGRPAGRQRAARGWVRGRNARAAGWRRAPHIAAQPSSDGLVGGGGRGAHGGMDVAGDFGGEEIAILSCCGLRGSGDAVRRRCQRRPRGSSHRCLAVGRRSLDCRLYRSQTALPTPVAPRSFSRRAGIGAAARACELVHANAPIHSFLAASDVRTTAASPPRPAAESHAVSHSLPRPPCSSGCRVRQGRANGGITGLPGARGASRPRVRQGDNRHPYCAQASGDDVLLSLCAIVRCVRCCGGAIAIFFAIPKSPLSRLWKGIKINAPDSASAWARKLAAAADGDALMCALR
jgi:hypothetical protein